MARQLYVTVQLESSFTQIYSLCHYDDDDDGDDDGDGDGDGDNDSDNDAVIIVL
jgi:hypothetical protein